ncbi:tetratricopeptide repeat protein 28-like [Dendronephthya gigantea]|uniref:tetratricopeptide repeat protein 28-like n=1 Tax=Dendronephthya gigantea TaxID=151771 RepID=UPI00106D2350|nr:tetratricopeptide repeat protein 28-like [Dendronephthya gigantea]
MALKLSQQLGHKAAEGRIHQSMAKSYYLSGQIEKALNSGKKALAIAEKVGDKAGEGRASGTIGNAYMEFGQNMQEARSKFREHLRIARDLCNKADEGDALASMAPFYIEIGQYSKALECCNSCLKIAENLQDKAREGRAYGNLGKFYIAVGRLEEAIESHQRHLKIATELDDKAEIGRANGNLGNAYSKIGQHQHAMKCHSKDKDIAEELGNEARNGRAQGNMGITYANMKQFEKAFNCHLEHLSIAEKLNDKSSLAKALLGLGEYHKNHDQFEKAIENFNRLLEISRPDLGSPELTAIAQEMLGQCYINSDPSKACSLFAKSIINFQDIRKSLREHDEFNVSMSNRFSHVHKLLLESLLNLKEVQTALVVSDCGKAQALRDLTWKKVQSCDDIPFDNFYKEDPMETIALDPSPSSLENLIVDSFNNILNFRQADAIISYAFGSNGELNSWVISQGVFHKSYKIPHERSMRNYLHRHISCLKGNLNVRTAQSSLREDFKVLPDIELSESNPLFSMSDENENYEGENIAEIHHLRNTDFVNNSCSRKPSLSTKKSAQSAPYNVDLQDLYAALIQPIEEHLYGSKLLIVPEGPLFTLPFPALLDPSGTYLCEKYSLQFIPSLHVLNFCLSRQPAQLGPALFVGNPEIDMAEIDGQRIKLPPLPNAEQEAIECSKYFNAQPLLKHQATKEKVLREIGNASVVHIASHGYFKHAEVFLAPNDGAPDHPSSYLLTAEDILRCRLNARLVVLSCCDSGRGEISSEGVVGIARSFLGSGARAVLVALWQIDDAATMEIMIEFYDKMVNGCSVCSALRHAMVAMKKKYPPSAWSPFQVIGEDIVLTYEEIEEIRRLSVSSLKEDAVPSAQNVYGNDGKDTDSLDELIAMLSLEGLT